MSASTDLRLRPRELGFTLLEAIVALSIVATAVTAAVVLLNFTLSTTNRMQESVLRGEAVESAAQLVDRMNPFETPDGEVLFADCLVRWQSRLQGRPQLNAVRMGQTGPFEVALFDVTVTGLRGDAVWFTFTAKQVGFRRVLDERGPFQ